MTERLFNYFDVAHAIATHAAVIEKSGGLRGIKDEGQINSILEHIQNEVFYPYFIDKITHLVFAFNKFHCFNDGNKRASLALSSYFLEINGHDKPIHVYTYSMEEVAIWLASSLIDQDQLKRIISFVLFESEYFGQWNFIHTARSLREPVERNLMSKDLLGRIIDELLANSGPLSEGVQLELLDVMTQLPIREDHDD